MNHFFCVIINRDVCPKVMVICSQTHMHTPTTPNQLLLAIFKVETPNKVLLTWLMHFCISLAMSLRRFDCLFLTKSWLCAALQIKNQIKKKVSLLYVDPTQCVCVVARERKKWALNLLSPRKNFTHKLTTICANHRINYRIFLIKITIAAWNFTC